MFRSFLVLAALLLTAFRSPSPITSKAPKTLVDATVLVHQGQYSKAEPLFRLTLQNALASNNPYYAARARVGLSICHMMAHQFGAAIETASRAMRYGIQAKDADVAVRAALNLSNVYRILGNYPAASETLKAVNGYLPAITDRGVKAQISIHLATEAARKRDWKRAEPLFYSGIDTALGNNDPQTAATAWNQLGYMRLISKDLKHADQALTEGFRLRRMGGNRNLGTSYMYLGILRMAQGDAASSLNLLNKAVEAGWNGEATDRLSMMFYRRAKAKLGMSDISGALADFREAIKRATQWRGGIETADDDRISFEGGLDVMYDDYVTTGMESWEKTRNPLLARLMFEAVEEHKSASFRPAARLGELPAEYHEALAEYRAVLVSAWRSGKSEPTARARIKLSQLEARLGLKPVEDKVVLAAVQRALAAGEALLSFSLGKTKSWMWAVTRDSVRVVSLPGRAEIAPVAKRYRADVETSGSGGGANTQLYGMLFGDAGATIQSKQDWLLSLDEGLFGIPFAALGPANSPLILFHSLRNIQGAAFLPGAGEGSRSTRFAGAGDAIYNSADPRWKGPRPGNTTQFARLISTGPDVLSAAQAWHLDPQPSLLLGPKCNRESLDRLLQQPFGVMHFAGHVVRHPTERKEVMIGIGLAKDGTPDFLTSSDIVSKSLRVGLVTLNGCTSGAGAELPGAGIAGMTRSWLMAGATAVAATYWPLPDDQTPFFAHMYREMAVEGDPAITPLKAARALRAAQLAAFRSGKAEGEPRRWAAIFLSSKR